MPAQVGSKDGFDEDEMPPLEDIDQGLMAQVGAMQVEPQARRAMSNQTV